MARDMAAGLPAARRHSWCERVGRGVEAEVRGGLGGCWGTVLGMQRKMLRAPVDK